MLYWGEDASAFKSLVSLREAIGVSATVFNSAYKSLLKRGLLIEYVAEPTNALVEEAIKPSRPLKRPHLNPEFVASLDGEWASESNNLLKAIEASVHHERVADLLFWDCRSPAELAKIKSSRGGYRGHKKADISVSAVVPEKKGLQRDEAGDSFAKMLPATRVLLAALLLLADPCGVVRNVSLSDLEAMVGVGGDRLEYQLRKLASMGYVRERVSGHTGRYVFGRGVGGLFLDLRLLSLPTRGSAVLLCFRSPLRLEDFSHWNGGRRSRDLIKTELRRVGVSYAQTIEKMSEEGAQTEILESIKTWLGGKQLVPSTPKDSDTSYCDELRHAKIDRQLEVLWAAFDLERLFRLDQSLYSATYQQYRVEQYASELLSEHWQLVCGDPDGPPDALIARIAEEAIPRYCRHRLEGDGFSKWLPEALGWFLYIAAFRLAYCVKRALTLQSVRESLGNLGCAGAQYALLPSRSRRASRFCFDLVVLLNIQNVQAKYPCVYAYLDSEGVMKIKHEVDKDMESHWT
jgi:hypothetical protein